MKSTSRILNESFQKSNLYWSTQKFLPQLHGLKCGWSSRTQSRLKKKGHFWWFNEWSGLETPVCDTLSCTDWWAGEPPAVGPPCAAKCEPFDHRSAAEPETRRRGRNKKFLLVVESGGDVRAGPPNTAGKDGDLWRVFLTHRKLNTLNIKKNYLY